MSASRRRRVAPPALLGLALAATLAATPRRATLELWTPRWTFSRSALELTIQQHGPLAGRRLAVFVFVDENMVGRVETGADRTEARLGDLELAPGGHVLKIKAGTEEATARFGVLSPFLPIGCVGAVLILVAGLRRRARRPEP